MVLNDLSFHRFQFNSCTIKLVLFHLLNLLHSHVYIQKFSITFKNSFQGFAVQRRFFLGGLNANTARPTITEYFKKYGTVISVMIFEAKNYGYIEFKKTSPEEDVQREKTLLGEAGRSVHVINGTTVTCKRATPFGRKVWNDTYL